MGTPASWTAAFCALVLVGAIALLHRVVANRMQPLRLHLADLIAADPRGRLSLFFDRLAFSGWFTWTIVALLAASAVKRAFLNPGTAVDDSMTRLFVGSSFAANPLLAVFAVPVLALLLVPAALRHGPAQAARGALQDVAGWCRRLTAKTPEPA